MTTAPKYIATILNVGEITLLGDADELFWNRELSRYGLIGIGERGRVNLQVSSTTLRWMGLPFCELAVSVQARESDSIDPVGGYFLPAAFNTSRLLAWMERAFFRTPYQFLPGSVTVASEVKASFGAPRMVRLDPPDEPVTSTRPFDWAGPLYLPHDGPENRGMFHVRIAGETAVIPYGGRGWEVQPEAGLQVFRMLVESGFEPREWHIRRGALHARSKTVLRAGTRAVGNSST